MKRINCVCYILACMLFMCLTACDEDNSTIEDEIPAAIKSDFSKRYPTARITTFLNYPDDLHEISFTDEEQNESSVWYVENDWKMTYTEISDINELPYEVQNAFDNLDYRDAQNITIFKTVRNGMDKGLYTFHFKYRWKTTDDVEHYVFINDDGLYLTTYTHTPNDTRWHVALSADHFDFINRKYSGAEIRGYINNGGTHEYYILHNDTIKCVSFRGEIATEPGFWTETRYELSIDTKIPENVLQVLKQDDPDFTYTNVYYIEWEGGNSYFLQDKNSDNDLGYTIGENLQPEEK